jgi:hypothetical protein
MKPLSVLYVSGGFAWIARHRELDAEYAARFDRERVAVDISCTGWNPRRARSGSARTWREGGARALPAKRPVGKQSGAMRLHRAGYDIVHAHMDGMNAYPWASRNNLACRSHFALPQHGLSHANPFGARRTSWRGRRIPAVATHLLACSRTRAISHGNNRVQSGAVQIVRKRD